MSLTDKEVLHLATLSRLSLTDKEVALFPTQLSDTIKFIQKVSDVEVSQDVIRDMSNLNTMREDIVANLENTVERNAIIEGMPAQDNDLLQVPKIL